MARIRFGWCGVLLIVMLALPVAGDVLTSALLSGVPDYYNLYGCAPTAGGMIIGYWDQFSAYSNLVIGDVSTWNTTAQRMVASQAWLDAGRTYVGHTPTSLADFMQTVGYDTTPSREPAALVAYAAWDDPAPTPVKEAYSATSTLHRYYEDLNFTLFQAEIDAGRPMLVNVFAPSVGHAVAAYGYREYLDGLIYYAVRDNWQNGLSMAPPGAFLENGVEWWPWRLNNTAYTDPWDWRVSSAADFRLASTQVPFHNPEPGALVLFALGLPSVVVMLRRRRRVA
jgi:hypothetical protein